jgi:acetolactate synthase-1/2/3 large subunit
MNTAPTIENKNAPIAAASSTMTGGEMVMQALLAENVELIFGYPGGAIMPIYDALYDYTDRMKHILVRHEQGAIHAAQGYARASGKTGVVLATSGPGATNLVTGLADALIDSTPLVCITGQVFAHLLGTDAFQEVDVINITTPVTKWNCQVTVAEDIAPALAKAFYIASTGRPGPVVIDITKNAQLQTMALQEYQKCHRIRSYRPEPIVRTSYIEEAIQEINRADRPFLIFGQGVILGNAEKELFDFVEKSGIPAAWTIMGKGAMPTDHYLNVGMLGMHGNAAPNILTNACDVLIAVGMRFDDRVTGRLDKYARQATVIHLDIDPAEIDKNVKSTIPVWGNCKETLPMLTAGIHKAAHPQWLEEFHKLNEVENEVVIQKEQNPTTGSLTMAEVVARLNELSGGEAIMVTDVGQHQMVVCRYARLNHSRSNITSGGLGTMGFALPAGIGAALAVTDRPVVAIIGDGGIQMTIQEMGTLMQTKAPLKIIILNNAYLGMVRQWQELFHEKRYSFVDISSPDYVALSAAYNIPGQKVSTREDLVQALETMLKTEGPYLLDVVVAKEDNIFPMVPQGKGVAEIVLTKDDMK